MRADTIVSFLRCREASQIAQRISGCITECQGANVRQLLLATQTVPANVARTVARGDVNAGGVDKHTARLGIC